MSANGILRARRAINLAPRPQGVGSQRQSRSLPTLLHGLVLAWVVLSTIETIVLAAVPYVDFIIGMIIVAALTQYASEPIRLSVAQYIFLGCLLVGGAVGEVPLLGLWWAGKLGIIFLIVATLSATPGAGPAVGNGLIASGCIHALVCAGGIIGVGWCKGLTLGDGRVGTVLSGPGALWRTVTFFLSYCLLTVLLATNRTTIIKALSGVALSALAIWCDGSRTALLVLPLALLVVAIRQFSEALRKPIVVAGSALLCAVAVSGLLSFEGLDQHAAFSRLTSLYALNGSAVEMLEQWDWARLQGIRTAVDAICQSPFVGNGLLTTVIEVDCFSDVDFDTQVVHNGYLQIWGDLGIFALLAFFTIVWPWLPEMKRTSAAGSPEEIHFTCQRYASLTTLVVFGLSFLLHPLTVTLNDWIVFIGPSAVLANQRAARWTQNR